MIQHLGCLWESSSNLRATSLFILYKKSCNLNILSQWGMWTDVMLSACLGGIPWQIYFARNGARQGVFPECKYPSISNIQQFNEVILKF